jgi:hypothetical protein
MAERAGFEPAMPLRTYALSKRAQPKESPSGLGHFTLWMAEEVGFEPTRRFTRQRAFQARAIGH